MANSETSDTIEAAIEQCIDKIPGYTDGDVLGDWVLICYVANPDEEKGGGYPRFLANGNMPNYRLRGLLDTGLKKLDHEELITMMINNANGEDDEF
jgi:hypothetical protein